MTLPKMTLTTNKTGQIEQNLYLRQSERGLTLTAQLIDYSSAPYDLTGLSARFKDSKAGGKSVSDDNVTIATDPKTGNIKYPIHSQVFAAKGIAWFELYNTDGTLVDSTENIVINVINDISQDIDNSDYISGLDGIKAQLQGIVNSAQQTLDNAVSGANTAASNANQAAQAAQALANDIPNNPKYRGPVGQTGQKGDKGDKGDTGDTGPTGPQGERGNQIYKSRIEDTPNGLGYWWSDLSPAPSVDNPPKIGDTVITPSGNILQIDTVNVGGGGGGGAFGTGSVLGNIKGPSGKDGKDGTGIQLRGSADSADKLPATGNTAGDTYLVAGHLYIWENNSWVDAGELQGPKGDDGRSAYQVWLDAGNTGTQADYLASLKGETGPAGKDGTDGKDGTTPDLSSYLKSADADAKYITQVSKTYSGDLNNLGTGGSYIIAPGLTNAPNATDYFFVNVQSQGTTADYGVNQIATDIATGEVYSRTKATGHDWTPWSHMVTKDQINTLITTALSAFGQTIVWSGTQAQYDALTAAQKAQYMLLGVTQ